MSNYFTHSIVRCLVHKIQCHKGFLCRYSMICLISLLLNSATRRKELLKGSLRRHRLLKEAKTRDANFNSQFISLCEVSLHLYELINAQNPTFRLNIHTPQSTGKTAILLVQ